MKVLIAGAGIAGPATAIALRKAGIASVLYEAYPDDAAGPGAFVTIAANGQDALHAIDARGPVLDASFPASRMRIFDPAGAQVADFPLGHGHPGPRTITGAYDIPALPTWHNDAMTVIGDAAHAASPSTAQGASMALEDAAVLARCLRDAPAIPEALALFEKLRRDRVERVVAAGAGAENPAPPTAPSGPRRGNPAEWLYGHHIDWHANVQVPR
jgi:2-polyprenyl-6-methoxyphenol hydroxylase-like FAD-dependent oxidoreductase